MVKITAAAAHSQADAAQACAETSTSSGKPENDLPMLGLHGSDAAMLDGIHMSDCPVPWPWYLNPRIMNPEHMGQLD